MHVIDLNLTDAAEVEAITLAARLSELSLNFRANRGQIHAISVRIQVLSGPPTP